MSDSPSISVEQVRHVARLARLAIPDEQIPTLRQQLEGILEYVAQIKSAPVSGIEPMAHAVPLTNVLRDDEPTAGLDIEDVLRNAAQTDDRFFKVPRVLGGDEDSAG